MRLEAAMAMAMLQWASGGKRERAPLTDEERTELCEYRAAKANREHWAGLNRKRGRNAPCSCGSGIKIKRCHGERI